MHEKTCHQFSNREGDKMKKMTVIASMIAGSMATIMFQKYKEPMLKAMKKAVNNEKQMINETLEDMM